MTPADLDGRADLMFATRLLAEADLRRGLRNLARCLHDAGALCEAFESGRGQGIDYVTVGEGYLRYMTPREWEPGCGTPHVGVSRNNVNLTSQPGASVQSPELDSALRHEVPHG